MLKRLSLAAALFLAIFIPLRAQTEKFLIGGRMGFSYSSDNPVSTPGLAPDIKSKTVAFSGAPIFGYFITRNIMAGIDFEFSTESIKEEESVYNSIKTKSLTLNPLVRVYFNSPFFTEIRFTWGFTSTEYDVNPNDFLQDLKYKSKTLGYGAGLGYDIKLADKVSLEPLIYYRWNTYKTDVLDAKSNQYNLFINLGLVFKI